MSSNEHPLAPIFPLRHPLTLSRPPTVAPLSLIEDSLTCSADFLLLHAISCVLPNATSKQSSTLADPTLPLSQSTAATSTSAEATATTSSTKPAVVLCAFRQSTAHYTQIARKWGVPFAPLQAAGSLYVINDLPALVNATAGMSASEANASEHDKLDILFRTGSGSNSSTASSLTPLQSFISYLLDIRSKHSSLVVLVDDLPFLLLRSEKGERDVIDAIRCLQIQLAQMDHAATATIPTSTAASSTTATYPSSIVLVTHGDVPVSPCHSLLRRYASTFLKLHPLQTGYTKEITGVLSAQQQEVDTAHFTPVHRFHYKLTDSSVKLHAPGHSTNTLEQ